MTAAPSQIHRQVSGERGPSRFRVTPWTASDGSLPWPPMAEPLRLLSVHAHPDDEASKGAGTVARYHAEGVRTVLVCCTGGEAGDILNPAHGPPGGARAPRTRSAMEELAAAVAVIGYDEVVMLGYRDSGMPDTPENADPRCFAHADLDEAVGRLVRGHPPRAAAGDPHLRRRPGGLPAPRPPAGARHLACRRSTRPATPMRTPSRASRGSR